MTDQTASSLERSISAFAIAAVYLVVLQGFLYLRPGPFGTAYVLDVTHYIGHAIFYGCYGLALISLPFILLTFWAHRQKSHWGHWIVRTQVLFLFLSLFASQVDHELQRFMGTHLSFDWLRTYGRIGHTPGVIAQGIADDQGGAYLSLILGGFTVLYPITVWFFGPRIQYPKRGRSMKLLLVGAVTLFYVLPWLFWYVIPGGSMRRDKVKPPVLLVYHGLSGLMDAQREFPNVKEGTTLYQAWWKKADSTGKWAFNNAEYPLWRTYVGTPPKLDGPPPNIIFLQLETFRAWSMSLYNDEQKVDATPYLTSMAKGPKGAWWTRSICNGIPTIYATMSLHMGILPHSAKRVSSSFTQYRFDGFPLYVQRGGYQTELFTGSDPDWDNQRYWYNRWYNKVHYDPDTDEKDRAVFRAASKRIKELGKQGPFMATVVSISNHSPFKSPEPDLNVTEGSDATSKILNTMRYTDEVVREFMDGLKDEPWFDRTVVIITGDHAYDLGDRGVMVGHRNLRHESTWVPIIIWGNDSRLPRGKQDYVASHIDLAPTIAQLAGGYDSNAFMGHSLLNPPSENATAISVRTNNFAIETQDYTAYFPKGGEPMLFLGDDLLQKNNVASDNPDVVDRLKHQTVMFSQLVDYVMEYNLVVPENDTQASQSLSP